MNMFMMATSRPLLSLVASLSPFSTTIPRSLLREYWWTERASGPVGLQNGNRITCFMTGLADLRGGTSEAISAIGPRTMGGFHGELHEVIIGCGTEVIARHKRSYLSADMIYDPIYFLPLIEQKVGALDQAAPLQGWDLPDVFATPRRLLEARMGKPGKREYVQVLRLLETFEMDILQDAIGQAIDVGAIGYDSVKHLVLCRVEKRPLRLDLDSYLCLPRANVGMTYLASYKSLMGGTVA